MIIEGNDQFSDRNQIRDFCSTDECKAGENDESNTCHKEVKTPRRDASKTTEKIFTESRDEFQPMIVSSNSDSREGEKYNSLRKQDNTHSSHSPLEPEGNRSRHNHPSTPGSSRNSRRIHHSDSSATVVDSFAHRVDKRPVYREEVYNKRYQTSMQSYNNFERDRRYNQHPISQQHHGGHFDPYNNHHKNYEQYQRFQKYHAHSDPSMDYESREISSNQRTPRCKKKRQFQSITEKGSSEIRRTFSGSSTASSLSIGGLSMSSYEGCGSSTATRVVHKSAHDKSSLDEGPDNNSVQSTSKRHCSQYENYQNYDSSTTMSVEYLGKSCNSSIMTVGTKKNDVEQNINLMESEFTSHKKTSGRHHRRVSSGTTSSLISNLSNEKKNFQQSSSMLSTSPILKVDIYSPGKGLIATDSGVTPVHNNRRISSDSSITTVNNNREAPLDSGITPVTNNRRCSSGTGDKANEEEGTFNKRRFFSKSKSPSNSSNQDSNELHRPVIAAVSHDDTVNSGNNSLNSSSSSQHFHENSNKKSFLEQQSSSEVERPSSKMSSHSPMSLEDDQQNILFQHFGRNNSSGNSNQSFTPLSMIENEHSGIQPTSSPFFQRGDNTLKIAPQLSWCTTGDSPPLHHDTNHSRWENGSRQNTDEDNSTVNTALTPVSFWEENDYQQLMGKKSFSLPSSPNSSLSIDATSTNDHHRGVPLFYDNNSRYHDHHHHSQNDRHHDQFNEMDPYHRQLEIKEGGYQSHEHIDKRYHLSKPAPRNFSKRINCDSERYPSSFGHIKSDDNLRDRDSHLDLSYKTPVHYDSRDGCNSNRGGSSSMMGSNRIRNLRGNRQSPSVHSSYSYNSHVPRTPTSSSYQHVPPPHQTHPPYGHSHFHHPREELPVVTTTTLHNLPTSPMGQNKRFLQGGTRMHQMGWHMSSAHPAHMTNMALPNHHHHHLPPPLAPHNLGPPQTSSGGPMYSKRKCVPLKTPIPTKFQGDFDQMKNVTIPDFPSLVNFPYYMSSSSSKSNANADGCRNCVMCGHLCSNSVSKNLKKKNKDGNTNTINDNNTRNKSYDKSSKKSRYPVIPTQNKGLCTMCDVQVWIIIESNLQIKWCKGCKNFRLWAAFGEKGLATKCIRCRDRQREKYALQKIEEKVKKISGQ